MKRKIIIPLIIILVGLMIYLINIIIGVYKDGSNQLLGFNTDLPNGIEMEIEEAKSKAYQSNSDDKERVIDTTESIVSEPEIIVVKEQKTVIKEEKKQTEASVVKIDTVTKIESIDTISNIINKSKKREFLTAGTCPSYYKESENSAITGCIYQNQKIKDGGRVIIKTLEKSYLSGEEIPKGTLLTGIAEFTEERIKIYVTSIKSNNKIIAVKLSVYDNDAQEGIYFPEFTEEKSIRTTGSDLSRKLLGNLGGSTVVSTIVNGGVDYISNRSSDRNVTLKGDYRIYLIRK